MTNQEDALFRDGCITPKPRLWLATVTVAGINFEVLHAAISGRLIDILMYHEPFRCRYDYYVYDYDSDSDSDGTTKDIRSAIKYDIDQLCNQAMNELWNRLRSIAETHHPPTLDTFSEAAPKFAGFVLPQFIADMLSSIGPLRIEDSYDITVIYAPNPDTSENFGRKALTDIDYDAIMRIITAMRAANIQLGTIQAGWTWPLPKGSFFTTCSVTLVEQSRVDIYGAFNHRHYTRNDIVMAMFFGPGNENQPFEDISLNIGFIDDEDVVQTIRSTSTQGEEAGRHVWGDYYIDNSGIAHASDIPVKGRGQGEEAGRHVWGDYYIDYSGIARASNIPVKGRGQGIYVLGRGFDRLGHCSLARRISYADIRRCLSHRILSPSTVIANPAAA